jgi:hypothetical protein
MNRRGFLSSLAALASTSLLPAVPSIPLIGAGSHAALIKMLYHGMAYGKTFHGGQVRYFDTDGVITTDIISAYPDWRELRNEWKIKSQS